MELALMCHNIVLAMQAMGLGGWMYTGINPPSLMGAFAAKGIPGLGFRFATDAAGRSAESGLASINTSRGCVSVLRRHARGG